MGRAFGSPQMNEAGQVHFIASWGLGGQKIVLYRGRPGAVNGLFAYRESAPSLGGEYLGFSEAHLNSDGTLLFRATMDFFVPPPAPLPHRDVIWRDTVAVALQTNPFAINHTGLPPAGVTGAPYTGPGRLQYKSNALLAPLFLADNGTGYHSGTLEAAEGNTLVPVADRSLIQSDSLTQRLVWYDRGPAPGLDGDHVFIADPFSGTVGLPLTFGKKNGACVARTTVRPATSGNPADNKFVFYRFADNQLAPFYVAGDPLPGGLPTPMELFGDDNLTEPYTLTYHGAQIADENGNTIIEVEATSFDRRNTRLIGVWKKMPQGLVEVIRYDRDYPVGGGNVRFSGAGTYKLGIDKRYAAMGNGKLAFWMHYTGLGQTFAAPALFRERKDEDGGGFERILTDGVTAPGSNYTCTGLDGLRHQALLMNAHREVAFLGAVTGGGAPNNAPALWLVDRFGALRHVVHKDQTMTIGGATKTVADFFLPNVPPPGSPHPYTPDTARILNDDGAIVFTVRFNDNTRAIIRAVPDGYIDPPPVRDYYFTGELNDRWYVVEGGGNGINWDDAFGRARTTPPGLPGMDLGEATVIPDGHSVVLDLASAKVGKLSVGDSTLDIRNELTVEGEYEAKDGRTLLDGPLGRLILRGGGNLGVLKLNDRNGEPGFSGGTRLDLLAPAGQEKTYTAHRGFGHRRGSILYLGPGATLEFKQSDEDIAVSDATTALAEIVEVDGGAIRSATDNPNGKTLRPQGLIWREGVIGSTQEPLRIELVLLEIVAGHGAEGSKRLAGYIEVVRSLIPAGGGSQYDDLFMDGGVIVVGTVWSFESSSAIRKLPGGGSFVVAPSGLALVKNTGDPGGNPPSINVRIDVPFDNTGDVVVDGPPESSLRITDGVKQLVGNTLTAGKWAVRDANILELSGNPIEVIGGSCVVELEKTAALQTFRLKQNAGHLTFASHEHSAPHEVTNSGTFRLIRTSKLAVNGFMRNSGKLEVDTGAEINVGGDFVHERSGRLKNNGTITALGRITLEGPLRGSGSFIPGIDGSTLNYMDIADSLYVGSSPGQISVTGSLQFRNTATLVMELAGTQANQFDFLSATRTATLGGTLVINLLNEFRPAPEDSFTIVQAPVITGQFANAAGGQRVATIDGFGSFVVNYTATSVVLNAFQANPNPQPTAVGTLETPRFSAFEDDPIDLAFTGTPGREYTLQGSTNLIEWADLMTGAVNFDGTLLFEVPPGAEPSRFFRARGR